MIWVQYVICVLIILYAGSRTAQYADIIAEKTRLGRLWVGMLMLAMVTSIPELVTSVSSVAVIHNPDLGLGTLIGTCIFNLCILVILDIIHRGNPIISLASPSHTQAVGIGLIMGVIIGAGILFNDQLSIIGMNYVSIPGVLVLIIYLVMLWRLWKKRRTTPPDSSLLLYDHASGRRIWLKFILSAITVIGTGIWLSIVGEEITEVTGWGAGFVGSLLLAITTSLPEITVAFASVRLGAIDFSSGRYSWCQYARFDLPVCY